MVRRVDLELLKGAVDMHVHAQPFVDESVFYVDVFDLAKAARDVGLDAIVVKNHYGWSSAQSYLPN